MPPRALWPRADCSRVVSLLGGAALPAGHDGHRAVCARVARVGVGANVPLRQPGPWWLACRIGQRGPAGWRAD